MSARAGEGGFSLVETLVSLAVIAAMTALLFEAVGANARHAHELARRRQATMLAHSLLTRAGARGGGGLATAGAARGLGWRVVRRPASGGARDSGAPLEEVRIDVIDSSTGRRLASVRTLRLAR